MKARFRALLAAALLLAPTLAQAASEQAAGEVPEVHAFQLDNGMKVLVRRDQRAPVVVSQIWYGVGAIDEHRGVTGVSHVLEHMMFKGTDDLGPGEMSAIVSRLGGEENAFTSHDYTAYYQQVAAEHLGRMLELEADRMTDLTLAPTQFEREIQVVREERRKRVADDPRALTHERLRAAAYPSSPTRTPVIGWRADLAAMSVAETRRWYQQWYAPNNAALVVVGDVRPERVRALAREHFGDKKRRELPARPAPSEIQPRGVTRVKVHAPATLAYRVMGWRVPALTTVDDAEEVYALDVLAGLLDAGRSARLARNLVRGDAIASEAWAGYSPLSRSEALFTAGGTPTSQHDVAALEKALRHEIEQIRQGNIGAAELERVKTNVRADEIFQRDSMFYQAMRIGILETVGVGQEAFAAYQRGIQQVTAAEVARVARQYLTDRRLTVATLVPEGVAPPGGAPAEAGGGAVAE
jgi:zinc protease